MIAQTVTCPHCKAVYTLPASLAEAIVAKCPECGRSSAPETDPTRTCLNQPVQTIVASEVPIHRAPDMSSGAVSFGGSPSGKFSFLTPAQQADELGRLGPYRILGLLGAGGMGIVFRAEDPALRRQIALKVMLPSFASDPKSKARFLREARAQAAIEHDHIIDIYAVGEEREIPYIAMPLLKGQTLADALKTNPDVPIGEAIRIAREMAEGLAAAHEQTLIHRDIKPANIWLESRHRRVKILDFGLARPETGNEGTEFVTHLGSVVGTPSHMSPEQAQGDAVDVRTDLFSLGVVLYQMLTAQQPFMGKNLAATLLAVMSKHPPRPASLNPQVPQALDTLTMRLLSKDKTGRPTTATAVAEALQAIEVDLNLTSTVPSVSTEAVIADPWMSVAKTDPDSVLPPASAKLPSVPVKLPSEPELVRRSPKKSQSWGPLAALVVFALFAAAAVGLILANKNKKEQLQEVTVDPTPTPTSPTKKQDPKLPDPPPLVPKVDPEPKKPDPKPKQVDPEPKKPDPKPKKVETEPKKVDPKPKAADPIPEAPLPSPAFDSRSAAEWVLNQGGKVQVNDSIDEIKTLADLPKERFRLTYIWLRNAKFNGASLACFKDCRTLTYVNLSNTPVADADLVYFKDCKNLLAINLSGTQTTDAGLAHFKDCKSLAALHLSDTDVGDSGLSYFKDGKALTYLNLMNTKATDVGVAYFKDCKGLTYANLSKTKITDAALTPFKDCKALASLLVSGTKVTAARIQEFAKTNPLCEITSDGGVIKPRKGSGKFE